MDKIGQVEYLIVHHTERNDDFPAFIEFRHTHYRGWDAIGYHYLIGNVRPYTKNGEIYTGRSEEFEGAHTLGHNKNSLGICLIGNFDEVVPSKEQFDSLFSLLGQKMIQHHVPVENVMGHNEFVGVKKSCPGKFVDMDHVRSVLRKFIE